MDRRVTLRLSLLTASRISSNTAPSSCARNNARYGNGEAQRRRRSLAASLPAAERAEFDHQGYLILRDALNASDFVALRRLGLDDVWIADMPVTRGFAKTLRPIAIIPPRPMQANRRSRCVAHRDTKGGPDRRQFPFRHFHPTAKAWFFLADVAR